MSRVPSNEYELLYQFETVFRDGEHRTQAASRDYSKVWESIIDNPPAEGVTPIHVYRLNGEVCAVTAGMDELVENEECAMEIVRLAREVTALREQRDELLAAAEAYASEWESPVTDPLYRRLLCERLFAIARAESAKAEEGTVKP